jgi:hypothetical protein
MLLSILVDARFILSEYETSTRAELQIREIAAQRRVEGCLRQQTVHGFVASPSGMPDHGELPILNLRRDRICGYAAAPSRKRVHFLAQLLQVLLALC